MLTSLLFASLVCAEDPPTPRTCIRAFVVPRAKIVWLDLETAKAIEAAVTAWRQAITSGTEVPATLPAKGFRGKFVEVPGAGSEIKPTSSGKAHPLLWAAFSLSGPGR